MIRLKCPSCSAALGVDDSHVGQSSFCPACGLIFTVPAPARLLDGDGRGSRNTPPPKAPEPTGPLLPEGPIDLAPDMVQPLSIDDWLRAEPSPRQIKIAEKNLEPIELAEVVALPSQTTGKPQQTRPPATIVAKQGQSTDWSFLTLDAGVSADIPLEPIMPERRAPEADVPVAPTTEAEVADAIPIIEEPEADVPEAMPVAVPATTPVALRVPATAEAIVATPAVVAAPEAVPVGVPLGRIEIPAAAPAAPGAPATPAAPAAPAQPEWNETPYVDVGLPRWMQKPKSTGGFVSLIPGLDDYVLAVIALATLWLILLIWVVLVPKVFWLPLTFGGLVWICGNFWFGVAFEDIGNIARVAITVLPLPAYPLFIVYGVIGALIYDLCALMLLGALAIPYIIRCPEWTLRPLGISSLGAGIVFTALFTAAANEFAIWDPAVPRPAGRFENPALLPAPPDANNPPPDPNDPQ